MRLRLVGFVLAVSGVVAAGIPAWAADLGHLRGLAGRYTDELLADPALNAEVQRILGDDYASFMGVMQVVFPSELIDNRYLVAQGCRAHSCGAQEGIVVIDLNTGDVMALRKGEYGYASTSPNVDAYIARWRAE